MTDLVLVEVAPGCWVNPKQVAGMIPATVDGAAETQLTLLNGVNMTVPAAPQEVVAHLQRGWDERHRIEARDE